MQRKLNILFSVFRYHTNMVSMVKALKDAGHEVLILVVAQEPYEDKQESLVQIIDRTSPLASQVFSVFEDFKPNAVVVRDALNEEVAPLVAREARKKKISCISYEQNPCYFSNPVSSIYNGLKHVFFQFRKGLPLIEMSPKRGAVVGYRVPFRKYFHFPICLSSNKEVRDYFADGKIRVTVLGKLGVPRKRIDWVVDALEPISDKIFLRIIGANDLDRYPHVRSKEYYKFIYDRTKAMRENCSAVIMENVPFHEMNEVYKSTDVFVTSSKKEKFGVSPLEAMSHGCAVICADDNGSTSYITDRHDGVVFDSDSYPDFRLGLLELVNSESTVRSLGRNAVSTIQKNHDCKDFAFFFHSLL